MVATALMVTAAPSALAAMALLRFQPPCAHSRQTYSREALNSHRTIMHASLSLAVLSSAYWGLSLCWEYYQVLQSARFPGLVRFPYRLLWLPATPLVAALLSKHVVDTSNDVLKSVSPRASLPCDNDGARDGRPDIKPLMYGMCCWLHHAGGGSEG